MGAINDISANPPMYEYFPYDGEIYKSSEIRQKISDDVYRIQAKNNGCRVYNYKPSPAVKGEIEDYIDEFLLKIDPVSMTVLQFLMVKDNPTSLPLIIEQNKKSLCQEGEPEKAELEINENRCHEEPETDVSYDNAYGLINNDVEDALSVLFKPVGTDNSFDNLIATTSDKDIEWYKKEISEISLDRYDESERTRFIYFNYRLSCIGIAPRWRGLVRDRHYKTSKDNRSTAQEAYLRDIQALDLEWLFRRYHRHVVDTSWNGVFEGIFSSNELDTKKISVVAAMNMTMAKKAEFLMLTPDMEAELFMIRSIKTDKFIRGLLKKSQRVRVDLLTAAQRNPKRGKRLLDNIDRRVNLWIASNLAPKCSISSTVANYTMMTGEKITPSNCKRLRRSLNDSLNEVGSKYVLS